MTTLGQEAAPVRRGSPTPLCRLSLRESTSFRGAKGDSDSVRGSAPARETCGRRIGRADWCRHPHPALSRRERVFVGAPRNDVVNGERLECIGLYPPTEGRRSWVWMESRHRSGRTGRGRDDETI
jgi:hypothetical protein